MTFSHCLRCDASFSTYKRDQHQCDPRKEDDQ